MKTINREKELALRRILNKEKLKKLQKESIKPTQSECSTSLKEKILNYFKKK